MNKIRLILYKLGLLRSRPINSSYRNITDFRKSYPWGRCLSKEQQYYNDSNVLETHNGYDFIIKKEHIIDNAWWNKDNKEFNYTSGMLYSKEEFKYGTFEADFFIPSGYGLWSAFWLFGTGENKIREIDIFEYYGEDKHNTYTIHYGESYSNKEQRSEGLKLPKIENSWHKYRLSWTKKKLKFYLDDKLIGVVNGKPFNLPMNLILNMAIEKNIGNKLDADLPTRMKVKNIRYYGIH